MKQALKELFSKGHHKHHHCNHVQPAAQHPKEQQQQACGDSIPAHRPTDDCCTASEQQQQQRCSSHTSSGDGTAAAAAEGARGNGVSASAFSQQSWTSGSSDAAVAAAVAAASAAAGGLPGGRPGEPSISATGAAAEGGANGNGASSSSSGGSSVIAVAEHCPAAMLKESWSLDAFEIRAKMYKGNISSVYRAVDRNSGITVGLKLYKRAMLNDMERHQIAREIWLHIQLHHSSIIALYAAWKDADYIYLVLEWAPEGNVFTFAQQRGGRLPESVVVPLILEPTMSALAYIHGLGMIHRDVKPENILLTTSYQIKLADFGLSIHANYEVANTRLGTIDYLSPEILDCPVKQHPNDHKANPQVWYTSKVDCWSVGVLAYELLSGRTPFEARTPQETLYRIKHTEVPYPSCLSPGAASFIRAALVRDPSQRASMDELLAHPWVQGHLRSARGAPHLRARTHTQGAMRAGAPGGGGGSVNGGGCVSSEAGAARVHSFGNVRLPPGGGSGAVSAGGLPHAGSGGSSSSNAGGASSGSAHVGVLGSALFAGEGLGSGGHNSCPNILHLQMSAPAGSLGLSAAAAAAAAAAGSGSGCALGGAASLGILGPTAAGAGGGRNLSTLMRDAAAAASVRQQQQAAAAGTPPGSGEPDYAALAQVYWQQAQQARARQQAAQAAAQQAVAAAAQAGECSAMEEDS